MPVDTRIKILMTMLTLGELISAITCKAQESTGAVLSRPVTGICFDSRQAGPGKIFVALKGATSDGHAFVRQAFAAGCLAAVVETVDSSLAGLPIFCAADSHEALAQLAAAFYGHPSAGMTTIAVTGTNGKTTTSYFLESILRQAGFRVGVIGTVNYRYPLADGTEHLEDASLTTPEPVFLQSLLRRMADAGVSHLIIEASSHAISQKRLAALRFDVAVFTNLSRDHLDYHLSMEAYFAAKQMLFTRYLKDNGRAVIVNCGGEDGQVKNEVAWGDRLAEELAPNRVVRCGLNAGCLVWADQVRLSADGIRCVLHLGGKNHSCITPLTGRYNLLNLLAAAASAHCLGVADGVILEGLAQLQRVAGRLDRVRLAGDSGWLPPVFVDYAHTPDALEKALDALRSITRGRLFCVFGCGGDRDQGKRPLMGQIAARLADLVVLTTDNSRSEDPQAILAQIEQGVLAEGKSLLAGQEMEEPASRGYRIIADRALAIRAACTAASGDDVVLIAGKGHETYQLIGGQRLHFDDREQVIEGLLAWTTTHLLRATSGTLLAGVGRRAFAAITTDTRAIAPGDVFVALRGERFNGHDFIQQAVEQGAQALIVQQDVVVPEGVCVIRVADTLQALGDLAAFRRRLLGPALRVVAITGSSGKTTVKEMTAAIFAEDTRRRNGASKVLKTQGNFNNLIGLPLTLLRVTGGHGIAILEMGMNQPGEIARLTAIADPDVGLINNIQGAHLEGLGSLAGVAQAKGELFGNMRPEAVRVINLDDVNCRVLAGKQGWPTVGFSSTPAGRRFRPVIRATRLQSLGERGTRFTLHIGSWRQRLHLAVPGLHSVGNAVAAAATAWAAGVDMAAIAEGLIRYQGVERRMEIVALPGGLRLLNDCYNANPASMAAALRTVASFGAGGKRPIRRVALLGGMLELGPETEQLHREIGELVAQLHYDFLGVKGGAAPEIAAAALAAGLPADRVLVAATAGELAGWIQGLCARGQLAAGDFVLLKGSRGMRMEEVLVLLGQQSLMTDSGAK